MAADGEAPAIRYAVSARFVVTRRVPWSDDAFRDHVDDVVVALRRVDGVSEIAVEVDLASGRTELQLVGAAPPGDVEEELRRGIGTAIRGCGAMHSGLLPLADEARLRPEVAGQWSGLRVPRWQLHSLSVGGGQHEEGDGS